MIIQSSGPPISSVFSLMRKNQLYLMIPVFGQRFTRLLFSTAPCLAKTVEEQPDRGAGQGKAQQAQKTVQGPGQGGQVELQVKEGQGRDAQGVGADKEEDEEQAAQPPGR